SQADGIIGVLPDATKSGKVNISGELRLKLLSAFGRGEQFEINWKQPLPKTQDLKTSLSYPFLFSLPFGLEGGLNIYKRDTSYVDVLLKGGIQYLMKGNDRITFVVSNKKSSLLSTSSYKNATVLPAFADASITTYGVVLKKEKVDYRLNPQRGFMAEISGGAGVKKIIKNSSINSELYKGIKLNSDIYKFEGAADFYQTLLPRIVLNTGIAFAWMHADDIFQNDQFRFGGLKSLRGFDEDVLYATSYYLGKIELRYILDRNAYLQLFYNQAYYASETRVGNIYDSPFGMGAGITFETKLGIFALNYAIGSQQNSAIQFRQAKVHFGIVNYF
ncbi:MAG: BamA/TamA family outer membrane protein, partial [Bacteroidetes bacterium]|nr:BamA/TamA family outer membrane protein [Bacteroidota bacterium]